MSEVDARWTQVAMDDLASEYARRFPAPEIEVGTALITRHPDSRDWTVATELSVPDHSVQTPAAGTIHWPIVNHLGPDTPLRIQIYREDRYLLTLDQPFTLRELRDHGGRRDLKFVLADGRFRRDQILFYVDILGPGRTLHRAVLPARVERR